MKPLLATIALMFAYAAYAAQPLSFDFMVTGSELIRPVLVFTDGENTYIQPPENIPVGSLTVKSAEAVQYGPYLMVKGVPKTFSLNLKKEQVEITYMEPAAKTSAQAKLPVVRVPSEVMAAGTSSTGQNKSNKSGACEKRIARSESAYMVRIASGSTKLPATVAGKLRAAIGDTHNIESIFINFHASNSSSGQPQEVVGAIEEAGVSRTKIHTEYKGQSTYGAEMRVVRSKLLPCAVDGLRIDAPHRGEVTVVATADARKILETLAEKLGMQFHIEGVPVPIQISIAEVEVPLVAVLSKIGQALNQRAVVVSRQDELVIRYRTN